MSGVPSAAPRHWSSPPQPRPVIPEPRPPSGAVVDRDRREDVRVAAIVAGLMLFTALVAIPFTPEPVPRVPVSIAR